MMMLTFLLTNLRRKNLQRCRDSLRSRRRELDGVEAIAMVPEDVPEGHFAVNAIKGGERKRFILELSYLTNPAFLRLLDQAEEEFGFQQPGVLSVPCQAEELKKVLETQF